MEDIKSKIEDLSVHITEYAEIRWKILSLDFIDKFSNIASSAAVFLFLGISALLVLLFGSVAAAFWIGKTLHDLTSGFLIVTGFYLFVFIVIFIFRKKIIKDIISNLLIDKLYDNGKNT